MLIIIISLFRCVIIVASQSPPLPSFLLPPLKNGEHRVGFGRDEDEDEEDVWANVDAR